MITQTLFAVKKKSWILRRPRVDRSGPPPPLNPTLLLCLFFLRHFVPFVFYLSLSLLPLFPFLFVFSFHFMKFISVEAIDKIAVCILCGIMFKNHTHRLMFSVNDDSLVHYNHASCYSDLSGYALPVCLCSNKFVYVSREYLQVFQMDLPTQEQDFQPALSFGIIQQRIFMSHNCCQDTGCRRFLP
jgi:hypothetical protein